MTNRLSTGGPGGQHPGDGNLGDTRKILPLDMPIVRAWEPDGAAGDAPLPGGPRGDDDFDYDGDTRPDLVLDPSSAAIEETARGMGFGSAAELEAHLDADRERTDRLVREVLDGTGPDFPDGFDGGDDRPPPGAPAVPAALTIRAPRGPQPVVPGFTVAAVVLQKDADGEDDAVSFAFLTPKKMQTRRMAVGLANYKAMSPARLPVPGATHIVVNDETGREVYRRALARAA